MGYSIIASRMYAFVTNNRKAMSFDKKKQYACILISSILKTLKPPLSDSDLITLTIRNTTLMK